MENLFGCLACCLSTEDLVYVSELLFILELVRTYNPISIIVCLAQQNLNSFKLIHLPISIKFYNMCTEVPLELSNFVFQRTLWQDSSLKIFFFVNLCMTEIINF